MKRLILLLLCLAILLCGCSAPAARSVEFFYRRSETAFHTESPVFASETRSVAAHAEDLPAVLEVYFQGPQQRDLESPFPRGTRLISWAHSDDTLILELSAEFGALKGIDQTIACACITRTCLALVPAAQVQIRIPGESPEETVMITMSENSLRLADDSLDKLHTTITLYYMDQTRRYLIGHEISVNLAQEDDVIAYLIQQLSIPPDNSGLYSCLPSGTRLLRASCTNGLCTLDFSSQFENYGWSTSIAQRLTLMSIVNTLTQLEDIQQVEFSIEGNLLAHYRLLNITEPLTADDRVIGPVRVGVNEFDATLYVGNGSDLYLSPFPARIRQSPDVTQAELVVQTLLNFQEGNGYYSTIPELARMNSVSVENGVCHVDLNGDFVESNDHVRHSVRSIVASVCSLEGIDSAYITINGQTPEGDLAPYFQVLTPRASWYL